LSAADPHAAMKWLQAKTDAELARYRKDLRIKFGAFPTVEERLEELTELVLGLVVITNMISEQQEKA
jgi:hypothetical protein